MKKILAFAVLFVGSFALPAFAQSYDLSELEGIWRGDAKALIHIEGKPTFLNHKKENFRIEVNGDDVLIYLKSTKPGAFHTKYNNGDYSQPVFRMRFDYFDLVGTYAERYDNTHGCNPPRDADASGEVSEDWKTITMDFVVTWSTPTFQTLGGPITGCTQEEYVGITLNLKRLG